MNRVVISVPRVLDSAVIVNQEQTVTIDTGNLPNTATAPFTVHQIKATPTETQMQNLTTHPLTAQTHCSRVTADVIIPVTLTITDANQIQYTTESQLTQKIDIVLYLPPTATFPYTITSEGVVECCRCECTKEQTTLHHATCKILTRVSAVTDLLIPSYGYAPINRAEHYHESADQNFLAQPLFPAGKVY